MNNDLAIISALGDLEGTPVRDYLDEQLAKATKRVSEARDVVDIYRAQGEMQFLQRLLAKIETADEDKRKLRDRDMRADPQGRF